MPQTITLPYGELWTYKPLFLDYLSQFHELSAFFSGDPYDPAAWKRQAEALETQRPPRGETATALRRLNEELGADEHALESLKRLSEGALVVISGQQVGLLGGPMYTLYKALTAVKLAREAETLLGRPVVPLFWMDADDHDFAEVRKTSILDREHELVDLTYASANGDVEERVPVGGRKLGEGIDAVVDRAEEALAESEFKGDMFEALRQSYAPGRTMAEAFGSWLLRMTRGTGLAVVDPTLQELKALGSSLFEREVDEGPESSELVARTTDELIGRGYHAQATPTESTLNLFYADPERLPIEIEGKELRLGNDGPLRSRAEVKRLVREAPERFSPNVLLRPVYQDTLFPTLAYVAGPNELAYFAQLRSVYERFDVTMPLIASRLSATIVERPQARFIERYGVEMQKLQNDDESLLNDIVREQTPPQLEEHLQRATACITEITKSLEKDLAAVDGSLVPTVKSTRGKLLHQIKDLESKALRALKRKNDTVRQQFLNARTALFPGFDIQERRLSPITYLDKYGWYFSTIVEESIDPSLKGHVLLYP